MHQAKTVNLFSDCPVTRIPSGEELVLPKGLMVDITQSLGGSHTVRCEQGLFRVALEHAGALGLTNPPDAAEASGAKAAATYLEGGPLDEATLWDALRTCYDPEIPVNIVDLGLVYDLHLDSLPNGQHRVGVKMTLTAAGCGMGPVIAQDAQSKLLAVDGVEEAEVEIVWDPPWHPSMISAAGKARLGLE